MREIDLIVVHCAATDDGADIGVTEIRKMHLDRGFDDIGYHYVIRRDGRTELGRPESAVGAHAVGFNSKSIGICLVGGVEADDRLRADFNYARAQMATLEKLLTSLTLRFPLAKVLGHRDLPNVAKACPCFNVRAWWYGPPNNPSLIA